MTYEVKFVPSIDDIDELESTLKQILPNICKYIEYPDKYGFIKLEFTIVIMKFDGDGGEIETKFYCYLPFMRRVPVSNIITTYVDEIFKRLIEGSFEGSGFLLQHITILKIDIAKDVIPLPVYKGNDDLLLTKYPEKLPGIKLILNILTKKNCLEYSMIAFF